MPFKLHHVSDNLVIFSFAAAAQIYKLPHWDWRKTILIKKKLFLKGENMIVILPWDMNAAEFISCHIVSKQVDKLILVSRYIAVI